MRVVVDGGFFRNIVKAVNSIVEEGKFYATADGLSLGSMDMSHVCYVDLNIPISEFKEYDYDPDQTETFAVNLNELAKIMSRAEGDLTLQTDSRKLNMVFQTDGKTRAFTISTLEFDLGEPKKPKLSYVAEAVLDADVLHEILTDAELVGDEAKITIREDEVIINGSNTYEGRSYEARVKPVESNVESEASAAFSLVYLRKADEGRRLSDFVRVSLAGNDKPIALSYGYVTYIIAPRLS